MKALLLGILASTLLLAADERQLALLLKAQSDFDRVDLAARPKLAEAQACIQSQAAAISVADPGEKALLHFHQGVCTLADAYATRQKTQYLAAAAEFDQAIQSWPDRPRNNPKKTPPEPVSSAFPVYRALARLLGSEGSEPADAAKREISAALEAPACNSNLMPADACRSVLTIGSLWVGWFALHANRFEEALRRLPESPNTGWRQWAEGRREFEAARYAAAAPLYGTAIERWKIIWQGEGPTFVQSLGPRPKLPVALADWGAARLLGGDLPGAISTLNAALQADPKDAHALFLRARARELSGNKEQALADYNLASRSAFAASEDLASGEAHLYRGIGLYRRGEFSQAEEEFAASLSFEMSETLRADARAWRHLAAVAAGSCSAARDSLNQALAGVSPYFPREEARSLSAACGATSQRL
ncbi:MAG: hypothetical protein ABI759_00565 [Candidatus Solibacter sp.]